MNVAAHRHFCVAMDAATDAAAPLKNDAYDRKAAAPGRKPVAKARDKIPSAKKKPPKLDDADAMPPADEATMGKDGDAAPAKKAKKGEDGDASKKGEGEAPDKKTNKRGAVDEGKKSSGKAGAGTALTAEEVAARWRKLSDVQHVLKRPDTYTGSTLPETDWMWVAEDCAADSPNEKDKGGDEDDRDASRESIATGEAADEGGDAASEGSAKDAPDKGVRRRMVWREVTYTPALLKIVDEIIVNAGDNRQRDSTTTTVKIDVDRESGSISVWNNGRGLPVTMHPDEKLYVPTLVFGEMRTSSNFDDDERRTTGGRNGYGAKLCNIMSRSFCAETQDRANGKSFVQRWTDNMSKRGEPRIRDCTKSDFTRVTFTPDYDRFGLKGGLDDDHVALLRKRAYDLAGTYGKLKVVLDGQVIQLKRGFQDYVALYLPNDAPRVYEAISDKCQVCVAAAPDEGVGLQHMSFVNGICTSKGGRHVDLVLDQVVPAITELIKKKKISAPAALVKAHLFVFVNVLVVNPTFESQTKTTLTTKKADIAVDMKLSDKFLKKLAKSPLIATILEAAEAKQSGRLKKTDGKKVGSVSVDKLEDATWAGGKNSDQCTLILTEGDSAKALAMSGLSVVGRQRFGVFPLRGKIVNVRSAKHADVEGNKEFANIKKIIGLKNDVAYTDTKPLRYGKRPPPPVCDTLQPVLISLCDRADMDYGGSG